MAERRPALRNPARHATPRPAPRDHLRITSAADRREHRVTETVYADAVTRATGRCLARCGHPVIMVALASPPGTPCSACADFVPDERTW